ncbi:ABC transporter substrate-binding protein [Pararhizobium polonicum]|uniref:ABC transporter substrate-binding protein n=1 Tax=Pararhizobium polonicum TaxID=1612624 RepID=A0A1C7P1F5_9HYPH|nr:ABC transporter substrate-binding protein [Pararhizobium polonicum]
MFRRRSEKTLRIGLLVPFQGADAIWGPSCQYSAVLAAAELNERGGILGRQIELLAADAGGSPEAVVERARQLVEKDGANVLVGVHLSSVRLALSREFSGRIPYVFAPLYEGGIEGSDVFAIGEVPERQFSGPARWMMETLKAKRWFLIGNDYVWPRASHRWMKRFVEENGGEIVGEEYVGIGQEETGHLVDMIEQANPDVVFQSLVGSECIPFNRTFAERGLAGRILRFSGAIEENTLLAIGEENTENLYCAAGYFSALQTPENLRFLKRYRDAFGITAPVQGVLSEACYEALQFLGALAARAGTFWLADLAGAMEGLSFSSARGVTTVRNGVACGPTFLARADGAQFEVLQRFG